MNKFSIKKVAGKVAAVASNTYARTGAALSVAMMSVPAFAQTGMSSGFTTEVEGGKAELWLIGAAVIGVCAIGFLISRGKKASN